LQKVKEKRVFIGAILAAMLLCIPIIILLKTYTTPANPIYPLYVIDGKQTAGWEIYTLEDGQKKALAFDEETYYFGPLDYEGQTFYMSRVMTEDVDEAIFCMDLVTYKAALFVGDELLYTDELSAGNEIGKIQFSGLGLTTYPDWRPVYVSLPKSYTGQTVTIALREDLSDYEGYVRPCITELSNRAGYEAPNMLRVTEQIYRGVLLIAIGLVFLIVYIIRAYQGDHKYELMLISFFVILWGGERMLQIGIGEYFMGEYITYVFRNVLREAYIMPLLVLLVLKMKKQRKWCGALLVMVGIIIVLKALDTLYWYRYDLILFRLENIAILMFYGVLLVCTVLEARQGNVFYRRFLGCLKAGGVILLTITLVSLLPWFEHMRQFLFGAYSETLMLFYNGARDYVNIFLLCSCGGIVLYEAVLEMIHTGVEKRTMVLRYQMMDKSYEHLKIYLDQTAQQRHETRRHMYALRILLRQEGVGATEQYIEQLIGEDQEIVPIIRTANELANQLINAKLSEAGMYGISMKAENLCIPKQIRIEDSDLCSVLLNILDNAIEACREVSQKGKKTITLQAWTKHDYLMLRCDNTKMNQLVAEKGQRLYESTKGAKESRGYGLRIIQKIAQKYNGTVTIDDTEDSFSICVALQIVPIGTV
ncbi:MAG: sensor histidine kinase, partial [Cellulosilyticaceae bacterium]